MEELPEDKNEAVPRTVYTNIYIYISNIPHESQYIVEINTDIQKQISQKYFEITRHRPARY
jgi:hypothetical protein